MRLIDAEPVREELNKLLERQYYVSDAGQFDDGTGEMLAEFILLLDKQPTVEERPVAQWKDNHCTYCGAIMPSDSSIDYIDEEDNKYCYNCGAKMIKEEKQNEY